MAEVAPQQAHREVAVLHPERAVEAELGADGVDVGLARTRLHQQDRGVAGHAHEQEDGDREQHQRDEGVADALEDVALHGRLSLKSS